MHNHFSEIVDEVWATEHFIRSSIPYWSHWYWTLQISCQFSSILRLKVGVSMHVEHEHIWICNPCVLGIPRVKPWPLIGIKFANPRICLSDSFCWQCFMHQLFSTLALLWFVLSSVFIALAMAIYLHGFLKLFQPVILIYKGRLAVAAAYCLDL
jgi:hypothetical protein